MIFTLKKDSERNSVYTSNYYTIKIKDIKTLKQNNIKKKQKKQCKNLIFRYRESSLVTIMSSVFYVHCIKIIFKNNNLKNIN